MAKNPFVKVNSTSNDQEIYTF